MLACEAAVAAGPLQTAITDQGQIEGADADLALARVRASGASVVRLSLSWRNIAPRRPSVATNPADPAYNWDAYDRKVRLAVSHGLRPIAQIDFAPDWAQEKPRGRIRPDPVDRRCRGPFRPSHREYGRFAAATAKRYSGSFAGLPRILLWQAWNDANSSGALLPQFIGKQPASP